VAKLVIVESPAKARTIGGYLGSDYVVESSIGHIRDLPNNAADTPAKIKDKPWGRLAVDVDNGFEPYYVVPRDKKSHIAKLKKLVKEADALYLATDEDREGEAIAWHLLDELKPPKGLPVHRMVFHEITKAAILAAVENPREINDDLVEAQEARRILDRLYGYEVSPVLWKKVMSGLSAGRVQSVATRLVVDKERERMKFRVASYWDLDATFDAGTGHDPRMFPAKLYSVDAVRVARGSDFDNTGVPKGKGERVHLSRADAETLAAGLSDTSYDVRSVESKPYRRSPYAPFRTTTLQQEASRKLGMSASVTMSVAQRLYENGFITYMRTDSTTLSGGAVGAARDQVRELYGAEYLPDAPRTYASKVKNAQEAHEAIRPAGESFRTPAQTGLSGEQFRLYELIWMRTVASQMKDAVGNSVTIRIGGAAADGRDVVFSSSGRTITFHGFLKAYVEDIDDASKRKDDVETRLPNLTQGDAVSAATLTRRGPRDQAAGALHRGDADQGARGPRDRPPVDVRLDHRHDPQPRLRLQEGHRAGAGVAGVLGDPAAGGALPAPGRPTSSPRSMEDVLDEIAHGRTRPRHRAGRVLLRRRRRRRSQDARRPTSATSTPRSWRPSRSARRRTASTSGSAATAPTSRGRRPRRATTDRLARRCGPTSPTTCRPTS
jgi:DNA topoisomerase I